MLNVSVLGAGQVGLPLIKLLLGDARFNLVAVAVGDTNKTREFDHSLIVETKEAATHNLAEVVVDALPDSSGPLVPIVAALESGKDVIVCNKGLIPHMAYLASVADRMNQKIILNSLISNGEMNHQLVSENITHKNVSNYDHQFLAAFRGGDGPATAAFIYNDLIKIIGGAV